MVGKGSQRLDPDGRRGGWLLVELMIAIAILTIGILSFLFSFQTNFRATHELGSNDQAQVAIDSVAERLRGADFRNLYSTFQDASFPVQGLVGPSGDPAAVRVLFFVNEAALPAEFGPLQDIDGDGIRSNTNASSNYILLPAQLTLNYQVDYGTETRTTYLILGPNR